MNGWLQRRPVPARLAVYVAGAAAVVGLGGLGAALAWGLWRPASREEMLLGLAAAGPGAAMLLGVAGYFIGRRVLAPIREMAEEARGLSAKTLGMRLPVANPHDELGKLAAGFNAVLQQLEGSFAELERFTADVSHELRTPLTAIRALGEVALRDRDPAQLRDTVGAMLEQASRMNQLVDRLLLLARADSEELEARIEAGLVRGVLVEVGDTMKLVAEEKGGRIEVECPDHLLAVFDPALLRLALISLVQNAVRYSPPGRPIKLRAFERDAAVVIEVVDEGSGIAPEHHRRIFERFYRVDKARSRAEGGAGLGLAIVKTVVERMRGSVEVVSEPGHGSVFRLRLRRVGQ